MTNALDTLKQTDQAAYEAVKNILPQTGNKLPALMLSFMRAAAQGVSLTSFIGEANVSALRATERGERLLKRLEKEFSASPKKRRTDKIHGKAGIYRFYPALSSNRFLCICSGPQTTIRSAMRL